jgi:O-antigen ligase
MGVGLWPLVTKQLSAHNDFLQLWLELGTFSMLLVAGYACCVLKQITIDRSAIYEASAVVTVAVLSAISFPLQIAPTRLLALAWIGILAAKKWRYRR